MKTLAVSLIALLSLICEVHSAEKTKPYPHYWMSISTQNQSMPGMDAEMASMASMFGGKGAGFGPRRELLLQLESPREASGPEAYHFIPPATDMGEKLPLLTPVREKKEPVRQERDERQPYEKPEKGKFRMLVYWGCGETPGKGQPKVFDSEKMNPADMAAVFKGRTPNRQTPPAERKGWTYGEWPHRDERKEVPKRASLVGEHRIKGNYVTDIPFTLDRKRDFMDPVEFKSVTKTEKGGMKVDWKEIPTASAYFATVMSHNEKTGEMIFWSSSDVQENGSALMDYMTNDDVRRFLKEKVFMEPSTTSCVVPAPVVSGGTGMLQFIGYGEELNLVHPPKPKDPKQPWDPQWSVKVRLKSTGGTPLMEAESGSRDKSSRKKRSRPSDEDSSPERSSSDREDREEKKGGMFNGFKGMLGF